MSHVSTPTFCLPIRHTYHSVPPIQCIFLFTSYSTFTLQPETWFTVQVVRIVPLTWILDLALEHNKFDELHVDVCCYAINIYFSVVRTYSQLRHIWVPKRLSKSAVITYVEFNFPKNSNLIKIFPRDMMVLTVIDCLLFNTCTATWLHQYFETFFLICVHHLCTV